jgi:medium-chain acyl-[acyl-carrier-protein] hydrolase
MSDYVFGGVDDVEVRYEYLEPWRELTISEFRLHVFPGDHFFVHAAQAQMVQVIAAALARLAR